MIYVIRCVYYDEQQLKPLKLLKIGYCRDDRKDVRLTSYRTENPRMQPLFFIEGGTEDHERRLHYKFREFLEEGREWFRETSEILDFFTNTSLEDLENLEPIPSKERKFSKIFYSELISEDSPDYIKEFFIEYDRLNTYINKIHFIVDYLLLNPDHSQAIVENLADSDKIKQQLLVLGPEKIKGLGYNITKIKQAMGITIFSKIDFIDVIDSEFIVGNRYSKKYIKEKLGEIYKKMDYKGTPKATDLEEWFHIKPLLVTNMQTKKRENGFEIISKK